MRGARRLAAPHVHVVAMKGDVELAEGELFATALLDQVPQTVCDGHAARVDPDERHGLEVVVALDDLVRDPGQGAPDRFLVQEDTRRRFDGRVRHPTPFRPLWTGLKGCGERWCAAGDCSASGRTESN